MAKDDHNARLKGLTKDGVILAVDVSRLINSHPDLVRQWVNNDLVAAHKVNRNYQLPAALFYWA